MALLKGEFHTILKKINQIWAATYKKSNDAPSYRAGEAPRTHPKGLARLPYIYNLETYQLFLREPLSFPIQPVLQHRRTFEGHHSPRVQCQVFPCGRISPLPLIFLSYAEFTKSADQHIITILTEKTHK